jgi:ABC-type glutathione transport system ATPase component
MKLLGIMGEAGCGKSTFAKTLIEQHGYQSFSFAGALKDLCAQLYGWERGMLDDLDYKESVGSTQKFHLGG